MKNSRGQKLYGDLHEIPYVRYKGLEYLVKDIAKYKSDEKRYSAVVRAKDSAILFASHKHAGLEFSDYEDCWQFIYEIQDGKYEYTEIVKDFKLKETAQQRAKEEAIVKRSQELATKLKAKLDSVGFTIEDVFRMQEEIEEISYKDLVDICGYPHKDE